ncbi:hypothetical protein F5Y05DRAFT_160932 [Hypoxylon sp. FL0543]|nr:hypothetical protein F5Y05DRAFT_160932 [Hypoxylon sp. FL0543]
MEVTIPADILVKICSFLGIDDVRNFRLCSREFAKAADCFVHRKVVFYAHHDDLDMLRHISRLPIASKNVHSLLYVAKTLKTPKVSRSTFDRHHYDVAVKDRRRLASRHQDPVPLGQRLPGREECYEKYALTMERQEMIFNNNEDLNCLREVVPRFKALQEITIICDWYLPKKTPFNGTLVRPYARRPLQGCRQFHSVIAALSEAGTKLKSLSVQDLHWKFFQNTPAELGRTAVLFANLFANLTCLRFCIESGMDKDTHPGLPDDAKSKGLLETRPLRDFIQPMTQLRTLDLGFNYESSPYSCFIGRLEDIIDSKHRWEYLEELTLNNIVCERQDLMWMLERHKGTLKKLGLRSICLKKTSWRILFPDIQETLDLDVADVDNLLSGRGETDPDEREWYNFTNKNMPKPLHDPVRLALNKYLVDDSIKTFPLANLVKYREYAPF